MQGLLQYLPETDLGGRLSQGSSREQDLLGGVFGSFPSTPIASASIAQVRLPLSDLMDDLFIADQDVILPVMLPISVEPLAS